MALAIVVLMLVPAEIWTHPSNDQVYLGFDRNLMYVSDPAAAQMTRDTVIVTAGPGMQPVVNLVTTSLQRFDASLDLSITDSQAAVTPARIGVWNPWTKAGYFIRFGAEPQRAVTAESIASGTDGATLVGGNLLSQTVLGHYEIGSTYHVIWTVNKGTGQLTGRVSGPSMDVADFSVSATQLPDLFNSHPVSFTASASPGQGSSRTLFENYRLTLPHARSWAVAENDLRVKLTIVVLVVLATLSSCAAIVGWIRRVGGLNQALSMVSSHIRTYSGIRYRIRPSVLVLAAVAMYLVGNAVLIPLGGHPFDMANEKLYAYVARTYGIEQLYYLPNMVSLAKIWGGIPFSDNAFPYEPSMAYLFGAIGWLTSLLFAGGSLFSLADVHIDYVIKAVNVLFGLGDSALIYMILRQLRVTMRWSLIGAGLFLLNPAVWFSMSIWGQNHVFSLFLVLLAVLLAERGLPLWAWFALAAASLTRPQMLVFGLLLGCAFLRKFSLRQNLMALSWTIVLVFVALAPLSLATSPSLPIDIALNNFHIQEATTNGIVVTTVSQDAYSIWPLVTYLAHGTSGLERAFTPASASLVGSITYLAVSQVLTLAALLGVSGVLLRNRIARDKGAYLPLVTLGITSFLMLQTGLVATHFLLALPFLLLCRSWMGGVAWLYVIVIWTVTTLVPMYGDMGVVISSSDYPQLAPANNALTQLVVHLYSWDRFITVGVVANICAVVWLAFLSLRPARERGTAVAAPA